MRTGKQRQQAKETQDEITKYEFALKAFVAIEHKFCSLEKMNVYQAKKLKLADAEPPPPARGREVTPDMVVEANGRRFAHRAIIEIKESLSALPKNWDAMRAQLEKYKAVTGGWDNAAPDVPHDVMLATGMQHAKKIVAWARKDRGRSGVGKWLIMIGIAVTKHGGEEGMEIAKVYGKISQRLLSRPRTRGRRLAQWAGPRGVQDAAARQAAAEAAPRRAPQSRRRRRRRAPSAAPARRARSPHAAAAPQPSALFLDSIVDNVLPCPVQL